jgi:hypothetical protein
MCLLDNLTDHVKVNAVRLDSGPAENHRINVVVTIKDGWFVYANSPVNKSLEPNRFSIIVDSDLHPSRVSICYPKGTEVKDPVAGNWCKYEGSFVVAITIRQQKSDPAISKKLTVGVQYSESDGRVCRPLRKKSVQVK